MGRYVTTGWIQNLTGDFFPWGTFAVNILGSLALGLGLVWLQAGVASAGAR